MTFKETYNLKDLKETLQHISEGNDQQIQTIIIYKTYTPQRKEYCKKYYQEHKEQIIARVKERHLEKQEAQKNDPDFLERKKESNKRYVEKLKQDPERLEKFNQNKKEYYLNKKLMAQQP